MPRHPGLALLQEILEQSQPRVSRHLRLLDEAGLVVKFRDGHWIYYRLAFAPSAIVAETLALVGHDDEQVARIRVEFNHFDKDGNGSIDLIEFRKLMVALSADMPAAEVETGFDAIDEDENGFIDLEEFLAWWSNK